MSWLNINKDNDFDPYGKLLKATCNNLSNTSSTINVIDYGNEGTLLTLDGVFSRV